MNKEKLKQEAKEFINNRFKHEVFNIRFQEFFTYRELLCSVVDFAESREKRITELEQKYSKQADNFENMKAGLESEVAELKEEIIHLKELLIELYDCIPASLGEIHQETLQKVALVFKED